MSNYSGITAEQARTFAEDAPATPEETLRVIENSIGAAAEQQQLKATKAAITKTAHTKQGAEYALLHLSTRGFTVNLSEEGPYYVYDIAWEA